MRIKIASNESFLQVCSKVNPFSSIIYFIQTLFPEPPALSYTADHRYFSFEQEFMNGHFCHRNFPMFSFSGTSPFISTKLLL